MLKRKRKNSKRRIKIQPPALKPHLTLTLLAELIRKNKKWKSVLFLILFPLFSLQAQVAQVPHLIHFQSTLTDPAGEALPDGLYTVHFRILDPTGGEFYREVQTLESAKGVVSAMVGGGGDLSLDVLDPKAPRFLGVTVEGQGPEALSEIGTVPYSLYAEQARSVAPQSIGAEAIRPGSITADLLSEGVLTELLTGLGGGNLPSVVISREELGGTAGANQIGVNANFVYSRGLNVQTVLKDLDTAVHQRQVNLERERTKLQAEDARLQGVMDQEKDERREGDNSLLGRIDAVNTSISASISANINESNSRMTSIEQDVQALSAPPRVVAVGTVGPAGGGCPVSGYNLGSGGVSQVGGTHCRVNFATPQPNASYVVLLTPGIGWDRLNSCTVVWHDKTTTGFSIIPSCSNQDVDIVVFGD